VPTRYQWGLQHEGFCLAPHVLAPLPTTPNPTISELHLYQACTFSVLFRRKLRVIVGATASRFSLARILKGHPSPVPAQELASETRSWVPWPWLVVFWHCSPSWLRQYRAEPHVFLSADDDAPLGVNDK
jgi:hypothetical protein